MFLVYIPNEGEPVLKEPNTAGPGGLGSWLVCRREHGLVHALGPGSGVGVFDASVPPQGGGGGGPIEAG